MNRPWLLAILIFAMNSVLLKHAEANEGQLLRLYEGFLQDGNTNVFVAFEREPIIPKMLSGPKEYKLGNGRIGKLEHQGPTDFYAICQSGAAFLIAFSKKGPITNPNNFFDADELCGFDGTNYWSISLNKPVKMPTGSFNRLTIIPEEESHRSQNQFRSDIHLTVIQGRKKECLNVMQMGCSGFLKSQPRVAGQILSLERVSGEDYQATAEGPLERPSELSYNDSSSQKSVSLFNYDANSLTIRKSNKGQVFFEGRYRILAVTNNWMPQARQAYSWQSYKKDAGMLIGVLITNGETIQVDFTNATTFKPARLLSPAEPIMSSVSGSNSRSKRSVVYFFFALAWCGGIFLMWKTRTRDST